MAAFQEHRLALRCATGDLLDVADDGGSEGLLRHGCVVAAVDHAKQLARADDFPTRNVADRCYEPYRQQVMGTECPECVAADDHHVSVVLIEDRPLSRRRLKQLLVDFCHPVRGLGEIAVREIDAKSLEDEAGAGLDFVRVHNIDVTCI